MTLFILLMIANSYNSYRKTAGPAHHIAVTGATGLLGGNFLAGALEANSDLTATVLVRRDPDSIRAPRWKEMLRRFGERIDLVQGDLSEAADCGRIPDSFFEAAGGLWHFAANMHLGPEDADSLSRMHRVNLQAVEALLARVERSDGRGVFHYISTAYVAGDRRGAVTEAELFTGQGFHNAYERSKLEAETRVRAASARGVPVRIYRPSIVLDEEFSGGGSPKLMDLFALAASKSIRRNMPLVLRLRDSVALNLVTGSWVTAALLKLTAEPGEFGETYHLTARKETRLLDILGAASERIEDCTVLFKPEAGFETLPPPSRLLDRALQPLRPYLESELAFEARNFNRHAPSADALDAEALQWLIHNFVRDNRFSLTSAAELPASKALEANTTR